MSAEYTVPALRDTANELRSKAAAHYAAEEIKARQIMETARRDADAMCEAAAEIDADADAKEAAAKEARQPHGQESGMTPIGPCQACGQPLVRDQLGNAHTTMAAAEQCPGPNPPVPVPPTTVTSVDTPEVTQ